MIFFSFSCLFFFFRSSTWWHSFCSWWSPCVSSNVGGRGFLTVLVTAFVLICLVLGHCSVPGSIFISQKFPCEQRCYEDLVLAPWKLVEVVQVCLLSGAKVFDSKSKVTLKTRHWCNVILSGSFPSTIGYILRTAFASALHWYNPRELHGFAPK